MPDAPVTPVVRIQAEDFDLAAEAAGRDDVGVRELHEHEVILLNGWPDWNPDTWPSDDINGSHSASTLFV